MKLTINKAENQRFVCADSMFFSACNEFGDPVTVDVSLGDWKAIQREWADDPVAKVEEMTGEARACWVDFGADRVWRVRL